MGSRAFRDFALYGGSMTPRGVESWLISGGSGSTTSGSVSMRTQHRMGFPDLHVPRPQLFSESESQSPPEVVETRDRDRQLAGRVIVAEYHVRRCLEARRISGGYEITVPAGTTRQVWIEFHPTSLHAATYQGRIEMTADGVKQIAIPLEVILYPLDFPDELSIAVGGWDYSHDKSAARDAAILDLSEFVRFLRGYGVNTPWAAGISLDGCRFDAEDYEYFAMLKQRVTDFEARGEDSAALQAAKKLLAEGPSRVTREISVDRIEWDSPKDRALMDQMRIQALDALKALSPPRARTSQK